MNLKNLIIVVMSLSLIGCIGGSGGGSSASVVSSSSTADYALAKSTSLLKVVHPLKTQLNQKLSGPMLTIQEAPAAFIHMSK